MTRTLPLLLLTAAAAFSQTQLTIYNQNFAVVKERRSFNLKQGENELRVADLTAHLEPDSVVLRDLKQPGSIRILEQNYESDPLSEGLLLRKSEGKLLDFEIGLPDGTKRIVQGRILRSGYVPHTAAFQRYGQQYYQSQMALASAAGQPIVEVAGKIQFGLPGKPIFDALDPKGFLKPTLLWRLWTDQAGAHEAEWAFQGVTTDAELATHPLLLLDVFLYFLWYYGLTIILQLKAGGAVGANVSLEYAPVIVPAALTAIVVDWLIVRWAWRKVNAPIGV